MKKLFVALLVAGASATAFSEQLIMQCGNRVYMMDTDKGQFFVRTQGQWKQDCIKSTRIGYIVTNKEEVRMEQFGEVKGKSYICLHKNTEVKSNKQVSLDKIWYDFLIGEKGWSMDDKVIDKQSCRLM